MEIILKTFQIPKRHIVYNTKRRLIKKELLILKKEDKRGRPKEFDENSISTLKRIVQDFPKDEIFTVQKAIDKIEGELNIKYCYSTVYKNLLKMVHYERKKDIGGLRRNLGPVIEYWFIVCNKLLTYLNSPSHIVVNFDESRFSGNNIYSGIWVDELGFIVGNTWNFVVNEPFSLLLSISEKGVEGLMISELNVTSNMVLEYFKKLIQNFKNKYEGKK